MKRKGSPHGLFPKEIRRKWVNTPSISQGIMKHIKYYLKIIFYNYDVRFPSSTGTVALICEWHVSLQAGCAFLESQIMVMKRGVPVLDVHPESVSFFTLCDGVQV